MDMLRKVRIDSETSVAVITGRFSGGRLNNMCVWLSLKNLLQISTLPFPSLSTFRSHHCLTRVSMADCLGVNSFRTKKK